MDNDALKDILKQHGNVVHEGIMYKLTGILYTYDSDGRLIVSAILQSLKEDRTTYQVRLKDLEEV